MSWFNGARILQNQFGLALFVTLEEIVEVIDDGVEDEFRADPDQSNTSPRQAESLDEGGMCS